MNKNIYLGILTGLLIAAAPFAASLAFAAQTTSTTAVTTSATGGHISLVPAPTNKKCVGAICNIKPLPPPIPATNPPCITATNQNCGAIHKIKPLPPPIPAPTVIIARLQAKIAVLIKQIAVLATEITQVREGNYQYANISHTQTNIGSSAQQLFSQLRVGSKGENVTLLQKLLATDPTIYPSRLVTGYYGHLTEDAVRTFQKQHGIEDVGEVGPKTRAVFNSYLSHATSTMPTNLLREFERENSSNGETQVSVCQRDGQSGKSQTISIAQSAVLTHIEQGDSIGSCGSEGERAQQPEHQSESGVATSTQGDSSSGSHSSEGG